MILSNFCSIISIFVSNNVIFLSILYSLNKSSIVLFPSLYNIRDIRDFIEPIVL